MKKIREKIKPIFLKISKPFLIIIAKIHTPFSSKKHVFEHFYDIQEQLMPGDTILTKSRGHLSNLFNRIFNPGKYMHTAIYIGKENGIPMVIDAIGSGVVKKSLPVFLADKDKIAFVRPTRLIVPDSKATKKSNKWLKEQIGKPYDYFFSFGNEKFYCSELNFFYYKVGNPDMPFARYYDGNTEVSPNDFYRAKRYFTVYKEIK